MKIFGNKRLQGAISIFLVMITIPTMLFSAVLIDGSRMASARAMAQEATDLAASSVLSSYHQELKEQFGLFALDEKNLDKVKEIYEESLKATLQAYGISADNTYSEQLWELMKTAVSGQKSYMGESFLNLYDFKVDLCEVEPMYSLANQEVLENQMVEYAKFRGLYVMLDRMDIFNNLGNLQEEAKKNETSMEVMEDKMEIDEANSAADKELGTLRTEIGTLNVKIEAVKTAKENYFTALAAQMEKIRIENIDTEETLSSAQKKAANTYRDRQKELKRAAEEARKQASVVLRQAKKAKTEVEKAIKRLEGFRTQNQRSASGNETIKELSDDAAKNIESYKTDYLPEIQKLVDDPVLNAMDKDTGIQTEINKVEENIHQGITNYIAVIEELRAQYAQAASEEGEGVGEEQEGEAEESETEEITEYYYDYLNSSESTTDAAAVMKTRPSQSYQPVMEKTLGDYIKAKWDPEKVNPSKKYAGTSSGIIDKDFAQQQSGKKGNTETNLKGEAAKGEVAEGIYNALPSKTFKKIEEKEGEGKGTEVSTEFYNEDNDLKASKDMMNKGKHSMILDIGETMRDDILCFTYMFGTFKTRLTGVEKFSSKGMSQADKNSFYMPEWRHAHPEGELDMRFEPKKDRKTVLRSEIEYLVYGNRSDSANEAAVYATIFAERMANNMIALYMENTINAACHTAAAAASAATLGVVPEPVFFWIFLTAWVTMETIIEMDYLLSGGYKIPLLKTAKNVLTKNPARVKIENYGRNGIFVSYEDYLLLLLLIKGKEKRIMRSADLIEMNMKNAGSADFTMANAYTYLRAKTDLSIRYLFGEVMPFRESYQSNGYSGRMKFTNTIYQGY